MADQTTTQIIRQEPPGWMAPIIENLGYGAEHLALREYTPYTGQRVAGFSPYEAAAQQGIASLAFGGGRDLPTAAQAGGVAGDYAGRMVGTGFQTWPGANISSYMNPYTQQVTDIAAREMAQAGRRQLQELGSQTALAGAFGGGRHALLEGDILQNTRQQVSDIAKRGQMEAYQQGLGAFQADRASQMAGLQSGLGAMQWGFGAGADLAGQRQAMALERLGAMGAVGEQQRQLAQQGMDIDYQNYLAQMQHPYNQMNFLTGILSQQPFTGTYGTSATTTQQRPQGSYWNQLLGAGLGGYGMYQQSQA